MCAAGHAPMGLWYMCNASAALMDRTVVLRAVSLASCWAAKKLGTTTAIKTLTINRAANTSTNVNPGSSFVTFLIAASTLFLLEEPSFHPQNFRQAKYR
jgi:hypothetical protein